MAVAVVLGASATAAVPGIEQGALAALAKLDRLLPRLRSQLWALRAATVSLARPSEVVSTEALARLAQACDGRQRATFVYQAQDGAQSERRVEPHRLVATDRRWYLVAFDVDRDDWRTFRFDRAASVVVTGHTFIPHPLEDPGRRVAEAITAAPYAHKAVARVASPLALVAKRVSPSVAVLRPEAGQSIVEIGFDNFDWVISYLIDLGLEFEVLQPLELREYLSALGERLAGSHRAAESRTQRPAAPARSDSPSGSK